MKANIKTQANWNYSIYVFIVDYLFVFTIKKEFKDFFKTTQHKKKFSLTKNLKNFRVYLNFLKVTVFFTKYYSNQNNFEIYQVWFNKMLKIINTFFS